MSDTPTPVPEKPASPETPQGGSEQLLAKNDTAATKLEWVQPTPPVPESSTPTPIPLTTEEIRPALPKEHFDTVLKQPSPEPKPLNPIEQAINPMQDTSHIDTTGAAIIPPKPEWSWEFGTKKTSSSDGSIDVNVTGLQISNGLPQWQGQKEFSFGMTETVERNARDPAGNRKNGIGFSAKMDLGKPKNK